MWEIFAQLEVSDDCFFALVSALAWGRTLGSTWALCGARCGPEVELLFRMNCSIVPKDLSRAWILVL